MALGSSSDQSVDERSVSSFMINQEAFPMEFLPPCSVLLKTKEISEPAEVKSIENVPGTTRTSAFFRPNPSCSVERFRTYVGLFLASKV